MCFQEVLRNSLPGEMLRRLTGGVVGSYCPFHVFHEGGVEGLVFTLHGLQLRRER